MMGDMPPLGFCPCLGPSKELPIEEADPPAGANAKPPTRMASKILVTKNLIKKVLCIDITYK